MSIRKNSAALALAACLAWAGSAAAWGGLELTLIGPTGEPVNPGVIQLSDGHGLVLYRLVPDGGGVYHVGSDIADYGNLVVEIEGRDDYKVFEGSVYELPRIDRDQLQLADLADVPLRISWRVEEGTVTPQNLDELESLADANASRGGKPSRRSGLEKSHEADCMAATMLVVDDPAVPGSTIGGPDGCESDIPTCTLFCSGNDPADWFKFIGTGGRVRVGTCPTGSLSGGDDTDVRVFTGPCDALACAANDGNDGSCGGGGIDSDLAQVELCTIEGEEYTVLVSSFSAFAVTDFMISVETVEGCPCPTGMEPPPINDECAGAIPLEIGVPMIGLNNFGATAEANAVELNACTSQSIDAVASSVWFSVMGDGNTLDLDIFDRVGSNGGDPDLDVVVVCADCDQVVCVDDLIGNGGSFPTQLGATYNMVIWGDSASNRLACFSLLMTSDGEPVDPVNDAVHCLPVGASCIKCLDGDASCRMTTEIGAGIFGSNYYGDDTTCFVEEGGQFQQWNSTSPPLFMPDSPAPPFIDVIVVDEDVPISNLEVSVQLTHTFTSDLEITLVHFDTGTTVNLMFDECGADNDVDATFSDFGEDVDCAGTGPITGLLRPSLLAPAPNMLSDFNGESSLGVWQLFIHDDAGGDTGIFNGWQLRNVEIWPQITNVCGPRNNGLGNGIDGQPGQSDNCNDCPGGGHDG